MSSAYVLGRFEVLPICCFHSIRSFFSEPLQESVPMQDPKILLHTLNESHSVDILSIILVNSNTDPDEASCNRLIKTWVKAD